MLPNKQTETRIENIICEWIATGVGDPLVTSATGEPKVSSGNRAAYYDDLGIVAASVTKAPHPNAISFTHHTEAPDGYVTLPVPQYAVNGHTLYVDGGITASL